jgi:hypothetical protein
MAKRFCETEIWSEDWFLDIPNEYKLLWNYIKDKCNHAGIWRPNKSQFSSFCGQIDLKKALDFFNNGKTRIIVLESGNLFLPGFFSFQYGSTFNENNNVHSSILKNYEAEKIELKNCYNIKNQIFRELTSKRGLTDLKEGVKDKEKDKDKEIIIPKKKESKKNEKFIPPTIQEVRDYFLGIMASQFEADKFYNYYLSNDWMVGKNKMKDWQAASRGWVLRNSTEAKPNSSRTRQQEAQNSTVFQESSKAFRDKVEITGFKTVPR